jgi:hypothetical protein
VIGDGTVSTANIGGYEVLSSLNFTPSASFLIDLSSGLDVGFASAVCANDIAEGYIGAAVPEPSTWLLFVTGLAGLLWWRQYHGNAQLAARCSDR